MCCTIVYVHTLCWALGVLLSSGSSGPSLGKFDFRVLSVMVSNVPLSFSLLDVRCLYLAFFFCHVYVCLVCAYYACKCVWAHVYVQVCIHVHMCVKTEADISVEAESLRVT